MSVFSTIDIQYLEAQLCSNNLSANGKEGGNSGMKIVCVFIEIFITIELKII